MKQIYVLLLCLMLSIMGIGVQAQSPNTTTQSKVASATQDSVYLMSFFKGSVNMLHYAYSLDGQHWININEGNPVFNAFDNSVSMRDPYMHKVTINGKTKYHLVHTWGWSHNTIFHWESSDLVNWTAANGGTTTNDGKIPVVNGLNGNPTSNNAWAPEFYYDDVTGTYYVYWASDENGYFRHWYVTTKDWITFSQTKLYFDPGFETIDMTIVKYNGLYYAYYKGENASSKDLKVATSTSLDPTVKGFTGITRCTPNDAVPAEGPSIFKAIGENKWFLYWDRFDGDLGLKYATTTNLSDVQSWSIIDDKDITNPTKAKHGSVETISKNELIKIITHFSSGAIEAENAQAVNGPKVGQGTGLFNSNNQEIILEAIKTTEGNYSGGSKVGNIGFGNKLTFTYDAAVTGIYGMYIFYTSTEPRNIELTVNGTKVSTRQCASSGDGSTLNFQNVELRLEKGINTIEMGNETGFCPDLDYITFYLKQDFSNLFNIYNVGTGKYIKTGGLAKGEYESPGLVAKEDAKAQLIGMKPDGKTFLIADPEFTAGWGIQGRNTIYESNNGSTSTSSWGTSITPGWTFVSTGEPDTYYIQYSWVGYTAGTVAVTNPANKTFCLYYGNYALSTTGWSDAQKNDVARTWVYADFVENLSKYGNNAKWKIIPVGSGEIIVNGMLEAEAAVFVNGTVKDGASAKYVDLDNGGSVKWIVNVNKNGNYPLTFSVGVPGASTRKMGVFVNGTKVGVITSSLVGFEYGKISASLIAGNNTIELRDSEGTAELNVDYLYVKTTEGSNTGVSDISFEKGNKLNIYPNLVSDGIISIDFRGEKYNTLSIFSINGMLVYSKQLNGENTLSINMKGILSKGMYLATAKSNNVYATQKIVVK